MSKTGRDRRKALRAERRRAKLQASPQAPMIVQDFTVRHEGERMIINMGAEDIEISAEVQQMARQFALSPSEIVLNQQMKDAGVPSFSNWAEKNLRSIAAREAAKGKPGAFLLLQMTAQPEEEIRGNEPSE